MANRFYKFVHLQLFNVKHSFFHHQLFIEDLKLANFPILVQHPISHHITLSLSTITSFCRFQWGKKSVFNLVHVMIKMQFRKTILEFLFSEIIKQCCLTSSDMDFITYRTDHYFQKQPPKVFCKKRWYQKFLRNFLFLQFYLKDSGAGVSL